MLVIYTPKPISARRTLPSKTRARRPRGGEQPSPRLPQRAASRRLIARQLFGWVGWCFISVLRAASWWGSFGGWGCIFFIFGGVGCWGFFFTFTLKRARLRWEPPRPAAGRSVGRSVGLEPPCSERGPFGSKQVNRARAASPAARAPLRLRVLPLRGSLRHLRGCPLGPRRAPAPRLRASLSGAAECHRAFPLSPAAGT